MPSVCLLRFSFTARSLTLSPLQRGDTATTLRHFTAGAYGTVRYDADDGGVRHDADVLTICGGVRYDADDGESLKKIVAPGTSTS